MSGRRRHDCPEQPPPYGDSEKGEHSGATVSAHGRRYPDLRGTPGGARRDRGDAGRGGAQSELPAHLFPLTVVQSPCHPPLLPWSARVLTSAKGLASGTEVPDELRPFWLRPHRGGR